ncbi:MAG: NmrA family NAD(P)-binding protein [Phycisphaeraceae bacterium]|nr:NmrA family NAD(P)-binding protein [Phycisphaeraceae bacterium]
MQNNASNDLTLVIGSSGKTGGRIVQRLAKAGRAVRLGSRSANVPFDWHDPSNWPAVLKGVKSVYIPYYPDLAVAEAPGHLTQLMEACKAAGVEKAVLLSGRGEVNAQKCEQVVRDSGLRYTLLRAGWFNQNFDEGHFLGSVLEGVIALPIGQSVEPFVDCDDIADVAFAALANEKHDGELYELTGPELLSMDRVAEILSDAVGHAVRYMPISFEEHEAGLTKHMGPVFAKFLTDLMREVMDGRNEWLGDGVQRALGREPKPFAVYAEQVAMTGIWSKPRRSLKSRVKGLVQRQGPGRCKASSRRSCHAGGAGKAAAQAV